MKSAEDWTEKRLEAVYRRTFGLAVPRHGLVSAPQRMSRLTRAIFTGVALDGAVTRTRTDNQRARS